MENSCQVSIVVDSAASLPSGVCKEGGIYVVPMQLTIGNNTYLDGLELTPSEFYLQLRLRAENLATSAPSPAQFLGSFEKAAQEHSDIVCLTVSRRFSSSFDSATVAAREAETVLPEAHISIIDTGSAAGGEGLVATEALRIARSGARIEHVADGAREVSEKVSILAFMDTLYYVWKGGRVPAVAHLATSLLRIKPLLQMSRGKVRNIARPRTSSKAEDQMLKRMRLCTGTNPIHAVVMHGDVEEQAEKLKCRVDAEFLCEELYVSEFSPTMAAHTGPGLLGVAFWTNNKRPGYYRQP